ncbi:MAG: DUF4097 family beta strand repeat-containing protein [Oscillospiraceae bacterium]
MNKFIKVSLIISGCCIGVGIIISTILFAINGWNFFANEKNYPNFARNHFNTEDIYEEFDQQIKSLDIDVDYTNITIKEGDGFSVDAQNIIENSLSLEVVNDKLVVKQNKKLNFFGWVNAINAIDLLEGNMLTLTIPSDFDAEDIDIRCGAGDVVFSDLKADTISISFGLGNVETNALAADNIDISAGAGDVILGEISATSSKFNLGLGNFTINSITSECAVTNLDFQGGLGGNEFTNASLTNSKFSLGAGDFLLSGKVDGDIDVECGMGECEINLQGNEDDFSYNINGGMGEMTLNGKNSYEKHTRNGTQKFELDGGAGDVIIRIK